MEHRKGYKHYLINGFGNGIGHVSRMLSMPKVQIGLGIIFALVSLAMGNFLTATAGFLGLGIVLNKDGLSGDTLKLFEEIEKRVSESDNALTKDQLQKELELRLKEMKENTLEKEKIDELKELLGPGDKAIRSILKRIGDEVANLKQGGASNRPFSVRDQVASWMEKNKEQINKVLNGESRELPALNIRAAASPMTPANTISNTVTLSAADVIRMGQPVMDIRRIMPTLWELLPKGSTRLVTFPWANKKRPADTGEANFIAPGVAKPGISFTIEVEQSAPKKIGVSLKTATELLSDIDGFTTYVQEELRYDLYKKVNSILMSTQAATSTFPAGIRSYAVGYTLSGVSVINPNIADCLRAVVCQIRTNFISEAILIAINPVDAANMEMTKGTDGQYVLPPFVAADGKTMRGAVIVEDNNVTAGNVFAIVPSALKTLIYEDFTIKWGLENDDLTKNLMTVIAETRFHQFHSENDAQCFVYDDFADIKSQIAAP